MRSTHKLAIAALEREGYSRAGWREALRKAVRDEIREDPFYEDSRDEVIADLEEDPGFRRLPDAYRVSDKGLEAVEVVVTNGLSDEKVENYVGLWWFLDSVGGGLSFDLFVMQPGGERRLLIGSSDFGTLLDFEREVGSRNRRLELVPAKKEAT